MLVLGLRDVFRWLEEKSIKQKSDILVFTAVTVAVVALSIPSADPWNGRLRNALDIPHKWLSFDELDQTAIWMRDNNKVDPNCPIITDTLTGFVLRSNFANAIRINTHTNPNFGLKRTKPYLLDTRFNDFDFLKRHFDETRPKRCGILVINRDKLPPVPDSRPQREARHWRAKIVNLAWYTDPRFEASAAELLNHGWTRQEVPPFYYWYEPK